MTQNNYTTFEAVLHYLGSDINVDDIQALNLREDSLRQLRYLLEAKRLGTITTCERAQLDAYREAAIYGRLGHSRSASKQTH